MYGKFNNNKQAGFTLIELMIAVVVIALLAMVAIPAYNDSVTKGRRADAKSSLSTAAARQEQFFMDNKTYTTDLTDIGFIGSATSVASLDGNYTVSVATPTAGCPIATCFELRAAPNKSDGYCQTFTLNSVGTQGVTGSPAPTQTANECW